MKTEERSDNPEVRRALDDLRSRTAASLRRFNNSVPYAFWLRRSEIERLTSDLLRATGRAPKKRQSIAYEAIKCTCVKVPAPERVAMMVNTALSDLRGKQWTEPIPPQAHRLMAYVDTAFMQKNFYLTQRQRISDVQHHRETDNLRRKIEITEGILHQSTLQNTPPLLNPDCFDKAKSEHRMLHALSTHPPMRIL